MFFISSVLSLLYLKITAFQTLQRLSKFRVFDVQGLPIDGGV